MKNDDADTGSLEPEGGADQVLEERRQFLTLTSLGLIGCASLVVGVPFVGFLVAPLFESPPQLWRPVGAVDSFQVGDIVEVSFEGTAELPWAGLSSRIAAWLWRESSDSFVAYSVNCSHLGCPVRWEAGAKLFMCPCHGGVYYQNGSVAAGPPPRGLTRYPVRIANNNVEIRTEPAPIT